MLKSVLSAGLILTASSTGALAFLATNDLVVEPTGPGTFEVPYRGKSGASDFWCAAGDYVIRALGLRRDTRIYRTSPPPRGSGEGITFSLSPDNAQAPGLLVFGGDGGLTASAARALCRDELFHIDEG